MVGHLYIEPKNRAMYVEGLNHPGSPYKLLYNVSRLLSNFFEKFKKEGVQGILNFMLTHDSS